MRDTLNLNLETTISIVGLAMKKAELPVPIILDIENIHPNNWNPNSMNPGVFEALVQDIKRNKFLGGNLGLKSTVGEAVIEQYDAKRIPVEGITFTAQYKHDMVQFLLLLFQQKRLKLLIQEQERIYSTAGTIKYQHPENIHDDQFWALCLALHVARDDLVRKSRYPILVFQINGSNSKSRWSKLDGPGITIISEASNRDYL